MLTEDEARYLEKIPADKIVTIKPFSQREKEIAEEIINKIHSKLSNLVVRHMGASGLGISGQGDLDIYALAKPEEFVNYFSGLVELFGEPISKREDSIAWEMQIDKYPIELYLTDPQSQSMKRKIAVFDILNSDSKLKLRYEALKADMNGKFFKEYQEQKYEFYHKILGD